MMVIAENMLISGVGVISAVAFLMSAFITSDADMIFDSDSALPS